MKCGECLYAKKTACQDVDRLLYKLHVPTDEHPILWMNANQVTNCKNFKQILKQLCRKGKNRNAEIPDINLFRPGMTNN